MLSHLISSHLAPANAGTPQKVTKRNNASASSKPCGGFRKSDCASSIAGGERGEKGRERKGDGREGERCRAGLPMERVGRRRGCCVVAVSLLLRRVWEGFSFGQR